MQPSIQYAPTRDGVSIACCTLGQGPPLVVLPLGPWSVVQLEWAIPPWRAWYERLAQRHQVVRFDLRGTGLSDSEPLDFTLAAQLADLQAVLDHLRLTQVALLAPQTAGPLAVACAARHPDRVSHLVLMDTYARGINYYGAPPAQALHLLRETDWALFTEAISHERLGWVDGETAHRLAALVRETVAPAVVQAFVAAAHEVDVTDLLPAVHAPTLVLHRRQILYPDVQVARSLASAIPSARLVLLEGSSMAPWAGDIGGFEHAIAAFLSGEQEPAARGSSAPRPPRPLSDPLSERELEVLRLIDAGLSNQEIAQQLVIALATVKTHINSIYSKLAVRSRTRALVRAREINLL